MHIHPRHPANMFPKPFRVHLQTEPNVPEIYFNFLGVREEGVRDIHEVHRTDEDMIRTGPTW
jgi:hypothetical protein